MNIYLYFLFKNNEYCLFIHIPYKFHLACRRSGEFIKNLNDKLKNIAKVMGFKILARIIQTRRKSGRHIVFITLLLSKCPNRNFKKLKAISLKNYINILISARHFELYISTIKNVTREP